MTVRDIITYSCQVSASSEPPNLSGSTEPICRWLRSASGAWIHHGSQPSVMRCLIGNHEDHTWWITIFLGAVGSMYRGPPFVQNSTTVRMRDRKKFTSTMTITNLDVECQDEWRASTRSNRRWSSNCKGSGSQAVGDCDSPAGGPGI